MEINNQRIIDFYNKYNFLNFENINIIIIDLFESFINTQKNVNIDIINNLDIIPDIDILNNNTNINDSLINELSSNELSSNELSNNELSNNELSNNELSSNELSSNEVLTNNFQSSLQTEINELESYIHNNNLPNSELTTLQNIDLQHKELNNNFTFNNNIVEKLNNIIIYIKNNINDNKPLSYCDFFKNNLVSLFPSCEINNNPHLILHRYDNKIPILIDNKVYEYDNVSKSDVDQFIYNCEINNTSGILISQFSGICFKNNFEINIINNNILIFIHTMNFDFDKILLACDIIDNLSFRLLQINNSTNGPCISNDILHIINEQYKTFINKREAIIQTINDNTKKTINLIKDIELSELNNFLSSHFNYVNTTILTCDICNIYSANSIKSLSNHKRSCKTKIQDNIN